MLSERLRLEVPFMPKDIKNRPVAFNIDDPLQRKLYEHSYTYTNFSAYVKMLILRDMDSKIAESQPQAVAQVAQPEIDIDLANSFI